MENSDWINRTEFENDVFQRLRISLKVVRDTSGGTDILVEEYKSWKKKKLVVKICIKREGWRGEASRTPTEA